MGWPSPEPVTLSVFTGGDSRLTLPVRPPRDDDAALPAFAEPEAAPGLEFETLVEPGSRGRRVDWDLDTDTIEYEFR